MHIKPRFKLKGKTWRIRMVPEIGPNGDCLGLTEQVTRTIYLRADLKEQMMPVFLHELFHVMCFEAHLHHGDLGLNPMMEEIQAEAFADLLSTVFELKMK